MSYLPEGEPGKWLLTVYDRDGGIINDDALFESEYDAHNAGDFWVDDTRYGSHEVEKYVD